MRKEPIRIGIIGAGENTRTRHIPGLLALDDVKIISVCNRTRESGEKVAEEFDIPRVYEHWHDVIYDDDINAIVIGTWPYLHAPATLLAFEHDKHVLCEARMAMNAQEAHRMYRASQAHPHLVAQIVPSPFTLRLDKTIKRILSEGRIGQPLVIEVRDGGSFLDPNAPLHWRQHIDFVGFNIMTLGIWYECILRWLGEATTVMALGKTFIKVRKDAAGHLNAVRVPDHLDVIADMAIGAQMHIQISAATGLAGPTEIFIFGDKGTVRILNGKIFGAQKGADSFQEIPVPPELEAEWRVEEEFINAIRGLEYVQLTTFAAGVKYMEFTEAVSKSMASGQKINLPL
ncbi:gfo/Idh/MocA family oxidoreductase [candidate division KSB1 bacterium]|nr:Gfo/Idh/MocA family oxidoreductase [candidate division KSB1 bacterium]RQW04182.1 MAG: gfo/Idh/MocA family oxidoreductase [candidate division KSB1 bacterium]